VAPRNSILIDCKLDRKLEGRAGHLRRINANRSETFDPHGAVRLCCVPALFWSKLNPGFLSGRAFLFGGRIRVHRFGGHPSPPASRVDPVAKGNYTGSTRLQETEVDPPGRGAVA
jgi:hypothetical protein